MAPPTRESSGVAWRRLFGTYFIDRGDVVPSLLLTVAVVLGTLAVPVLLMRAVDSLLDATALFHKGVPVTDADRTATFRIILVHAGLIVVAVLVEYGAKVHLMRLQNRAIYRGAARLRVDLYGRIQAQSLNFHRERRVGRVLSQLMSDVATLQDASLEVLSEVPFDVCTVVCLFAVIAVVHPAMTGVIAGFVLLVVVISLYVGRRGLSPQIAAMETSAGLTANLQEALSEVRVLQAFGAGDEQIARVEIDAARHAERMEEAGEESALIAPLYAFAEYAGLIVALVVGSWFVLHGSLSPGGLALFIAYMGYISEPAIRAATLIPKGQRAIAAAIRIGALMKETDGDEGARGQEPARVAGHLRVEALAFRYAKSVRPALERVDFTVTAGEKVAVIGANAAGKSTLLDLLLKLQTPDSGGICVDGIALEQIRTTAWLRQVGIVLQEVALMSRSIAENISMGDAEHADVRAAAKRAGVDEAILRLPSGYDTIPGERGATLSGGERQRVAIARLFLRDPAIVLLDEPTSALDAQSEHDLLPALQRLCEGRTTFVVSHRLPVLRDVDKVLLLHEGRQLAFDTPIRVWERFPEWRGLFPPAWGSAHVASA